MTLSLTIRVVRPLLRNLGVILDYSGLPGKNLLIYCLEGRGVAANLLETILRLG